MIADLRGLGRLFRYMRPYRRRMIVGLVAGGLYGAISGVFPKAVEFVFSNLFESGTRPELSSVMMMALAIPCYFVTRGLMNFLNVYSLAWVSGRMLRDIRLEMFEHLQKMSLDFFVRNRVPRLIQRVNNNTSTMQGALVELAGDLIKQPITIVAAIVVLAYIDLWFLLFALVLGLGCLLPISYFGRRVRSASRAEDESAGAVLALLHESFNNVRVIKAYMLERLLGKRFDAAANRQMKKSMYFKRQRELISPLIDLIGSFGIAATLVYVYFRQIPMSEFLAVVSGFFMMYDPLKRLGRVHVTTQRVLTISERVFKIMDIEPSSEERTAGIELTEFRDAIRFENIRLRYQDREDAVKGVDLTIPKGSVCALIGPSGSGKTSLVNLLLRFYRPTSGRVTIDGQDLSELSIRSVRQKIALVTQETFLFADTVANNIGYGRRGATRDEIVEAAKRAHAHEFIETLPDKYDTVLSDRGQNLSGGQAQRIAIARAFLKDPPIFVLDEATSALDAESESYVQEAMNEVLRGRTVLVIAHRLSTVRHADQFVVMHKGEIVEAGGHDELVGRDGLYKRLYDLQVV